LIQIKFQKVSVVSNRRFVFFMGCLPLKSVECLLYRQPTNKAQNQAAHTGDVFIVLMENVAIIKSVRRVIRGMPILKRPDFGHLSDIVCNSSTDHLKGGAKWK